MAVVWLDPFGSSSLVLGASKGTPSRRRFRGSVCDASRILLLRLFGSAWCGGLGAGPVSHVGGPWL